MRRAMILILALMLCAAALAGKGDAVETCMTKGGYMKALRKAVG